MRLGNVVKHYDTSADHVRASVEHSLANLRTFPWLRMRENKGDLTVHGAWFDISLGELHVYDEAQKNSESGEAEEARRGRKHGREHNLLTERGRLWRRCFT